MTPGRKELSRFNRRLSVLLVMLAISSGLIFKGQALLDYYWVNAGMITLSRALNATSDETQSFASQAELLLSQAQASVHRNTLMARELGLAIVLQGREQEAEKVWQNDKEISTVLVYHATIALHEGNWEESLDWCNRAYRMNAKAEQLTPLYIELGKVYRKLGDYQKSLMALRKARDLSPENREVWYELGLTYANYGEYTSALAAWNRGLEGNDGTVGLSNLYYRIGYLKHRNSEPPDLSGAWDAYEQALQLDDYPIYISQKAATFFQRGHILLKQERWLEAVTEFEQALTLNPDHYAAYLLLARSLFQLDRTEEAKNEIHQAIELQPDNPEAYRFLGDWYRNEGNTEDAIIMYAKVLSLDPDNDQVREFLQDLEQR